MWTVMAPAIRVNRGCCHSNHAELTVAGKQYWKISDKNNEYVLRSSISQHTPSPFVGARFGDDTGTNAPLGFVWPRSGGLYVWARRKAVGGGVTRQLTKRTAVAIFETTTDAAGKPAAYRINESEWVDANALRVFAPAPLPRGVSANERWIDIDLDTQILVGFEGSQAVYATLVSSGGRETPTETGVYRMWKKVSETDMNGLNGEDPYSVATVPWTQFFSPEQGLAIHTAYWHNDFGTVRSHGCINVAPQDARWLYFWSDPQTPPGWSMSAGVLEQGFGSPQMAYRRRHRNTIGLHIHVIVVARHRPGVVAIEGCRQLVEKAWFKKHRIDLSCAKHFFVAQLIDQFLQPMRAIHRNARGLFGGFVHALGRWQADIDPSGEFTCQVAQRESGIVTVRNPRRKLQAIVVFQRPR
jgi:hypothetical protein